MRRFSRFICAVFMAALLVAPARAFASPLDFDFRLLKADDHLVSEIWYDHTLFWRIAFSPNGAVPAMTGAPKYQTVITPSFEGGSFMFHIQ